MARSRNREVQPVATGFEGEVPVIGTGETATVAGTVRPPNELEAAITEIKGAYGPSFVIKASQMVPFNHCSTGVFMLDFATLGGPPEGLATMIYGWESSGKTTIALKFAANYQWKHPDKRVVWIDAENTLDREYAKKQGVNVDDMYLVQPESGEQAVDALASVIDAWETGLVIVDSIPALVPQKEQDESVADVNVALLARLCSRMSSKILASWTKQRRRNHWVTIIFINQFRSKIGVMFGDPRTLPGGNQIRYLVTTRIEMKNKEKVGKDRFGLDIVEENEHSFNITKAKVGNSIRAGEFQIAVSPDHERGMFTVLEAKSVATYAKKMGLITGAPQAWYINDVPDKFKGVEAMEEWLYKEPGEFLRLKQKLVAFQRIEKGLRPIPNDGYLLDWNAGENLADIEQHVHVTV